MKRVGRFLYEPPCRTSSTATIEQTHANGSDEVTAVLHHMDVDQVKDLQYVVNRLLEDMEK